MRLSCSVLANSLWTVRCQIRYRLITAIGISDAKVTGISNTKIIGCPSKSNLGRVGFRLEQLGKHGQIWNILIYFLKGSKWTGNEKNWENRVHKVWLWKRLRWERVLCVCVCVWLCVGKWTWLRPVSMALKGKWMGRIVWREWVWEYGVERGADHYCQVSQEETGNRIHWAHGWSWLETGRVIFLPLW